MAVSKEDEVRIIEEERLRALIRSEHRRFIGRSVLALWIRLLVMFIFIAVFVFMAIMFTSAFYVRT